MSNARDKANIPSLNFSSTGIDDNATSTAITINSSQQVGIGTASAGYPLEINSSAQTTLLHLVSTAGTTSAITFANTGSNDSITIGAENDDLKLRTDDGVIKFFTNENSEKMRIDSSGKISIGDTTSSGYRLKIKGTLSNNADDQGILLEEAGTGGAFIKYDGAANLLKLGGYNAGEVDSINIVRNTGDVGIGTSSPTARFDTRISTSTGKVAEFHNSSGYGIDLTVESNSGVNTISSGTTQGLAFATNSSSNERMRIDSSGNVGIGTSSPTAKLDVRGSAVFNESGVDVDFRVESLSIPNMFVVNGADDRVYINSSTNVSSEYFLIRNNYTRSGMTIKSNTTNPHHAIEFHNPNNQVGSINTSGSSVVYNTSSDYRLKENVSYDFDATSRLKQLKPARFNFIADADTTVDGFLAHEVSSVVPEAITGTHNELEVWKEGEELPEGVSVGDNKLDENGNTIPKYQGIDQSKLVPLLVKTIQELEARITTLEANNP